MFKSNQAKIFHIWELSPFLQMYQLITPHIKLVGLLKSCLLDLMWLISFELKQHIGFVLTGCEVV